MPLYRCDWPNGETSFVLAHDEQDAIDKLDEFDAAETSMLREVSDFMISIARVPVDDPDEGDDYLVTDIGGHTMDSEFMSLHPANESAAHSYTTPVNDTLPDD